MSRIRIKDIARLARVSAGTVDRVIHHRVGVSESTRKKVQAIIEEYNYTPDILAGMLASNRMYRFLVCMPDTVDAHEFWKFPVAGVEKAYREIRPFDVEIDYLRFNQHRKSDFTEKTEKVDISRYDGMLFAPVFNDLAVSFLSRWDDVEKPYVLFNSRIQGAGYRSFVGQDAFQSGYLGGSVMSYGLPPGKDLLIVNLSLRKDNYDHIIRREKGFRSFFEEHGERINNLLTLDLNGGRYERISRELDRVMTAHDIAGIFVTNSRVYLVARYLSEKGAMGMRLIGYDLLPQSIEYLEREYIDFLISQSPEEQAYRGLKNLFDLVVMKQEVPAEVLLPIDLLKKENVNYYI